MIVCQSCGAVALKQVAGEKCPQCGVVLNSPSESNDGQATLDAGDNNATLDAGENANTIQPTVFRNFKTVSKGPDATLPPSLQTQLPAPDQDSESLHSRRPIDATVDAGDNAKTVSEPSNSATIDFGDSIKASAESGLTAVGGKTTTDNPSPTSSPTDVTIDSGSVASFADRAQASEALVSRGRASFDPDAVGDESVTRWTRAAGDSQNPLLSYSGNLSFNFDDTPLVNKRRLTADPNDTNADYELIRAVGRGAMGEVFAAKQKSLNRTIALKTISTARSKNAKDQRKFLYEARITGELNHPNIVPVHDLAEGEDGTPFYSMKLVTGTPWQKVIETKSVDENLEILMKVSDAIGFSHSQNIIHRDLKPENIMLGSFGEVLVMDWGLAIDLSLGEKFDLAGTPAYMAPEMAKHEIEKIGPASDIYLLGAMLYHIVTGTPPHPGRTVTECVMNASSNKLMPPRDPDNPLLKIAMVAIATEPKDRYATVGDFQEAIRDYRRHSESVAQTQRADNTLQAAILKQDYESYSRALFGFDDAIQLWPENQKAIEGAQFARLSYGQLAVEKNDFDLALQILRPNVDGERELYETATQGKLQAQQRVKRIRRLTNLLATGGTVAAIVFLLLSLWAMNEKNNASKNEKLAIENANVAKANEDKANEALDGEIKAKAEAEKNAKTAKANEDKANIALAGEIRAKADLEKSYERQVELTNKEAKAKKLAEDEKAEAERQKRIADNQRVLAEQAQLTAEVRNYPANVALAATQIQQRDVGRSLDILQEIDASAIRFGEVDNGPRTSNWALERIRLATNQDIPSYQFSSAARIHAVSFQPAIQTVALGGEDGVVELVHWTGREFTRVDTFDTQTDGIKKPVNRLALAVGGEWVAMSQAIDDKSDEVVIWQRENQKTERIPFPSLKVKRFWQSPDGDQLFVALERGGLRMWSTPNGTAPSGEPTEIATFSQYEILDIAWNELESNATGTALISFRGKTKLAIVDFRGDGSIRMLDEKMFSGPGTTRIASMGNVGIVCGQDSGALRIVNPNGNSSSAQRKLPSNVHPTRIEHLDVSRNEARMLSVGLESVIHVWDRDLGDEEGRWSPKIQLLGHGAASIVGCEFWDSDQTAVSVDVSGKILFWDLDRQAERQSIERPILPGEILFAGGKDANALMHTVDSNGSIDTWHGMNGRQIALDGTLQFVGHSPDAKIQDLGMSEDGTVVVTSAVMQLEPRIREFCAWDFATGQPIRRWTDTRSGFPCVAVSPAGDLVVVGTNGVPLETVVVNLRTGIETILVDDKGRGLRADDVEFNREKVGRITSSAYSGMVAEFEQNNDFANIAYNREAADPPTSSSKIVGAGWSGEHFYVFFDTGHFRQFGYRAGNLKLLGTSWVKDLALNRGMVDWVGWTDGSTKDQNDAGNRLTIASRAGGSTKIVTLGKSPLDGTFEELQRESLDGSVWIIGSGANVQKLDGDRLQKRLGIGKIVRLEKSRGGKRFVAATAAGTFVGFEIDKDINDPPSQVVKLGRSACVAADGSQDASQMVTAHQDGQLWHANFDSSVEATWKAIQHPFRRLQNVRVSPDGTFALILGLDQTGNKACQCIPLVASASANPFELNDVVDVAWQPVVSPAPPKFVSLRQFDGALQFTEHTYDGNEWMLANQASINWEPDFIPTAVGFFGEHFADRDRAAHWYWTVLAGSSDSTGSQLSVIDASQLDVAGTAPGQDRKRFEVPMPSKTVTTLANSFTDNLLAVGDAEGSVAVWFMAPSIDARAFELISVDRHRGRSITQLAFSTDSGLMITGDSGGRQFVWLATDPTHGNSKN